MTRLLALVLRLWAGGLASVALWGAALAASEAPLCNDISHDGVSYTICRVDLRHEQLRLFLERPEGGPFGQFSAVEAVLAEDGLRLGFAMNAGMYHASRTPVGLFVEEGREVTPIVTQAGPGNFGLLPNGVFCIRPERADVIESRAFATSPPPCDYATQSGPMLVIDGALHPRFLVDSTSRYVRNGVGTSADGQQAIFAISNARVTFHEFGRLFRDVLGTPNALYFDGNISRLYAPEIGRSDTGFALGPIVGVVRQAD